MKNTTSPARSSTLKTNDGSCGVRQRKVGLVTPGNTTKPAGPLRMINQRPLHSNQPVEHEAIVNAVGLRRVVRHRSPMQPKATRTRRHNDAVAMIKPNRTSTEFYNRLQHRIMIHKRTEHFLLQESAESLRSNINSRYW